MTKHNYKNPSKKQDFSHVEAQVTKGKKYYDDQGWEISAPISDAECIYKALDNARHLAGLDRKQVVRLCDDFAGRFEEDVLDLESEYPPL